MKRRLLVIFSIFIIFTQLSGCFLGYGSGGGLGTTSKATRSDLVINFTLIPGMIFNYDTYHMTLQAQEEITNLSLEIDFRNSSGRVLKTDELYVGKVVPGNKYEYTLDQSGMRPEDLDTVSSFIVRVDSGTVKYN